MRLADHVVEKLLALVQERGLQPGQKLPAERQLAEVSEPVRNTPIQPRKGEKNTKAWPVWASARASVADRPE